MADPPRNHASPRRALVILGTAVGAIIVLGFVISKPLPPPPPPPPPSPEASATTPNNPPTAPGAGFVYTDNLSVTAPPGWQIKEKTSDGVSLQNGHGQILLGAHQMPLSETPGDLLQADLATVRVRNPDAQICFGPQRWSMPNGPADGQVAIICYQSPSNQGQPSHQSAELYIEAVNSAASVEYFLSLWMPNAPDGDAVNAFAQEASPIINTVVWHPKALPSDNPKPLPSYTPFSLPPHQQLCLPTLNGAPMPCVP